MKIITESRYFSPMELKELENHIIIGVFTVAGIQVDFRGFQKKIELPWENA